MIISYKSGADYRKIVYGLNNYNMMNSNCQYVFLFFFKSALRIT